MSEIEAISGYQFRDSSLCHTHDYLFPVVERAIATHFAGRTGLTPKRVFDLGCGNGSTANQLHQLGYEVAGVDPSSTGIASCKEFYSELDLRVGSAYDDLKSIFGNFPVVISLEVVEHVYAPRHFASTLYELVEPNGIAIVSTPYHGYLKNLILALTGKLDNHFTALWDHGHIKFWSVRTLGTLLREVGFRQIEFVRVGRIAPLAKSMIAIAHK